MPIMIPVLKDVLPSSRAHGLRRGHCTQRRHRCGGVWRRLGSEGGSADDRRRLLPPCLGRRAGRWPGHARRQPHARRAPSRTISSSRRVTFGRSRTPTSSSTSVEASSPLSRMRWRSATVRRSTCFVRARAIRTSGSTRCGSRRWLTTWGGPSVVRPPLASSSKRSPRSTRATGARSAVVRAPRS